MDPFLIYNSEIYLTKESFDYQRRIYGFFDLLGDLGGVTEAIVLIFAFIFIPISEHQFTIEASKMLFLARTKTTCLFEKKHDNEKENHNHSVKFNTI